MKKLDQLTVTRFIAALSVILYHSGMVFPFNRSPFIQLFASGQIAVNYFFVLSGFVMCLAYYQPEKKLNVANYYLSRFSRIYPVYLLSFLITCLYYFDLLPKIKTAKILANLFLIQAWVPDYVMSFNYVSWSLSVEAFFYLVFPFLLLCFVHLSARKLIWFSAILWAVVVVFQTGLLGAFLPEGRFVLYYNPLFYLSGFILGCAAGIFYLQFNKESVNKFVNLFLLAAGLGLLTFVLIIQKQLASHSAFAALQVGLLSPLFTLIVFTLAIDRTFVSKVLSNKWLTLLGDSSYALFILNIPVRLMAERLVYGLRWDVSHDLFYYVYTPIVILFSIFIHLKFERPVRDWLLANRQMIRLFAWDVIFISLAVGAAYFLRMGWNRLYFDNWRVFVFTLRVSVPIMMMFLFLFRLYQPSVVTISGMGLVYQIITPVMISGLLLSGVVYWAYLSEVVEAFPMSVLLICFGTLFCFVWLSRFLFSRHDVERGFCRPESGRH